MEIRRPQDAKLVWPARIFGTRALSDFFISVVVVLLGRGRRGQRKNEGADSSGCRAAHKMDRFLLVGAFCCLLLLQLAAAAAAAGRFCCCTTVVLLQVVLLLMLQIVFIFPTIIYYLSRFVSDYAHSGRSSDMTIFPTEILVNRKIRRRHCWKSMISYVRSSAHRALASG